MDDLNELLTIEKRLIFLDELKKCANVTRAAKRADLSRIGLYYHKNNDSNFSDAWDEALKIGIFALEDMVNKRAFLGVDEPVFQGGEQVGTIRKYSDTLAIFLLKAHNPKKYRENMKLEVSGDDGAPVQIDDNARMDRLASIIALAQARKNET